MVLKVNFVCVVFLHAETAVGAEHEAAPGDLALACRPLVLFKRPAHVAHEVVHADFAVGVQPGEQQDIVRVPVEQRLVAGAPEPGLFVAAEVAAAGHLVDAEHVQHVGQHPLAGADGLAQVVPRDGVCSGQHFQHLARHVDAVLAQGDKRNDHLIIVHPQ